MCIKLVTYSVKYYWGYANKRFRFRGEVQSVERRTGARAAPGSSVLPRAIAVRGLVNRTGCYTFTFGLALDVAAVRPSSG